MIHRLNEQVLDSEDSEVNGESRKRASSTTSSTSGQASPSKLAEAGAKNESTSSSTKLQAADASSSTSSRIDESDATSTLRTLVEENDKMAIRANDVLPTTGIHNKSAEGSGLERQCDDCSDTDDSEPRCHIRIKSDSAASLSEVATHQKQEEIDAPSSNKRARLT